MIDGNQQIIAYELNCHTMSEGRNHLPVKNILLYASDDNKAKWLILCN